jgi:hypothetical protein
VASEQRGWGLGGRRSGASGRGDETRRDETRRDGQRMAAGYKRSGGEGRRRRVWCHAALPLSPDAATTIMRWRVS